MKESQQKTQGELVKSFGLYTAFMLVVSSIIGSGVFKKVAPMSAELMSPSLVLLCWVLAGTITLFGALTNAEVAGLIAGSGGQYVYFRKMYGKMFAFLYGWACFTVIQSSSIASISYVFAESFNALIPLPNLSPEVAGIEFIGFKPFDNFGVKIVSIGLITLLTSVNYRGLKYGGMVSNIFTAAIVISIFSIILLGLTISEGSFANLQTDAAGFVEKHASSKTGLFGAIFAALLSAFWAYEGWNSLGFLGSEIKDPNRNIPLALMFGVLFVMATYTFINLTYLYIMPIEELITVANTKNSIAAVEVVKKFMGEYGTIAISILILVATFGCTNTTIMTASRIYYAMALNGIFFRAARRCHPEFNTPSNSLVMQGAWASLLVLSGSFDQLTDMLIFASFIFYGSAAFGVFVLRRTMKDVPRPYKAIGYPVIPAVFVVFCAVLVTVTLVNQPREAGMGLFLIMTGIPFYLYWNKNNTEVIEEVTVAES